MEKAKSITVIGLLFSPGSEDADVYVPTDRFANLLEKKGIVKKVTKLDIQKNLAKLITTEEITLGVAQQILGMLKAENFMVTSVDEVDGSVQFQLF